MTPQAAAAKRAAKAAAALEPLRDRFAGQMALIFGSGPSLADLWNPARAIPCPAIAVNDAWQIAPKADVLYASDDSWWRFHRVVPEFDGFRVGCFQCYRMPGVINLEVTGQPGYDERLGWLRTGNSSGYAATHLAAQLGARKIVLVGFDLQPVKGRHHFFGEHDPGMGHRQKSDYAQWCALFAGLGKELTARGIEVVNATPGSALKCVPAVRLEDVVEL
jgi:hypothetical protein